MILKLSLILIGLAIVAAGVTALMGMWGKPVFGEEEEKKGIGKMLAVPLLIAGFLIAASAMSVFYIPPQTSGLVTLKTGAPLQTGQLIAMEGQRGQQAKILTPGYGWDLRYPFLMDIEIVEDLVVPSGHFVVLKAKDGAMNPEIVAPFWDEEIDPKRMIEDFNYFIENGGTRGIQQYLLTTGNYRINRFQWDVKEYPMINIEANEVMVIESKFGKAPAFKETSNDEILSVPLVESEEYRGIVDNAYPSGYYAVHPITQKAHEVSITLQTFIYGGGYTSKIMDLVIDAENDKLITESDEKQVPAQKHGEAFAAKTKDNHTVYIDVRVLGQIEPTQAPRFIGTMANKSLDDDIIEPYTRNVLTNIVLTYEALELKDKKEELGTKLSEVLRERTKNTGFRTKTVEITNIDIPPIVLIPGKISSASDALKSALIKKEASVEQAIKVRNMQAQADNQDALAQATVDKLAAQQKASTIRELADANKYASEKQAEADSYKVKQEADALEYRFQKQAKGVEQIAKVIGEDGAAQVLLQETINQAADKFNVPDMIVYGAEGGASGEIVGAKIISESLKSNKGTQ